MTREEEKRIRLLASRIVKQFVERRGSVEENPEEENPRRLSGGDFIPARDIGLIGKEFRLTLTPEGNHPKYGRGASFGHLTREIKEQRGDVVAVELCLLRSGIPLPHWIAAEAIDDPRVKDGEADLIAQFAYEHWDELLAPQSKLR